MSHVTHMNESCHTYEKHLHKIESLLAIKTFAFQYLFIFFKENKNTVRAYRETTQSCMKCCVTWRIHMRHDKFTSDLTYLRVTWLIHVGNQSLCLPMTNFFSFKAVLKNSVRSYNGNFQLCMKCCAMWHIHMRLDKFMCERTDSHGTWLIHAGDQKTFACQTIYMFFVEVVIKNTDCPYNKW